MIENRHKRLIYLIEQAEKASGEFGRGLEAAAAIMQDGQELSEQKEQPKKSKKRFGDDEKLEFDPES